MAHQALQEQLEQRRQVFERRINAYVLHDLRTVAAAVAVALPAAIDLHEWSDDVMLIVQRNSLCTDLVRFAANGSKGHEANNLFWRLAALASCMDLRVDLQGISACSIWNYVLQTSRLIEMDVIAAGRPRRWSIRRLAQGDRRLRRHHDDPAGDVADLIANSLPKNSGSNSGSPGSSSSSSGWFSRWWDGLFSGGSSRGSGSGGGSFWDGLF